MAILLGRANHIPCQCGAHWPHRLLSARAILLCLWNAHKSKTGGTCHLPSAPIPATAGAEGQARHGAASTAMGFRARTTTGRTERRKVRRRWILGIGGGLLLYGRVTGRVNEISATAVGFFVVLPEAKVRIMDERICQVVDSVLDEIRYQAAGAQGNHLANLGCCGCVCCRQDTSRRMAPAVRASPTMARVGRPSAPTRAPQMVVGDAVCAAAGAGASTARP